MKNLNTLLFILGVCVLAQAQRVVPIAQSGDPSAPTDLFAAIMGDTTATGDRVDNNTVYTLENGGVYIITDRLANKPEWPLHIRAVDTDDLDNKPIITRIPNADGSWPDMMRPEGDVTMTNLWLIVGQKGPGENHDWGKIRFLGADSRLRITDCIMEKDRGGFVQVRAPGMKIYVEGCTFRNGGNRRVFQGNGRGIDARNFALDTLVMRNTVVHNIQDRFFRSQGAMDPHNYIEIDNCTSFNTAGRHGHIQLGRVLTAKITNNLFINPIMLGTTPAYTDEQTQPDRETHKVITLDTLYDGTNLTISNNNAFWTQDVLDAWNSIDSVSAPGLLSQLVEEALGGAAGDAFFSEEVELASVPQNITQYVLDLYADPGSMDMFDFIVEDASLAGTAFDSGNLFDFSTYSPCYPESAASATASTRGGAIGAISFCPDLKVSPDLREVLIEASDDPTNIRDLYEAIMGDTLADGNRVSNNTVYLLENGEVYIITDRLANKPEWPLHIRAVDLDDVDNKPVITRIPNADGSWPDMMRPEGDVTLTNLWLIVGQKGPGENHDWGKIRFLGADSRVRITDCIMEKDRGGFVQVRAAGMKVYVDGCIFRNGGNRRVLQGNGRAIDARNFALDSLVMTNTVVHNIQDRFFRSQGAMDPHNYIEIDNCTSFNTAGRHGHIQLGRVLTAKITDNLFVNPIMLGTSPVYTDEQTQPDNETHKVITLDTLYAGTNLTISNNNAFWTQDVVDAWNSIDSVSAPGLLSQLVMDNLGAAASDAFFSEEVALASVPQNITQYVLDLYADPTSMDMFDFIVEDESLAGTSFDSGNLFDFDTFSPCYDSGTQSASAGTDGGPIGAVETCTFVTVEDVPHDESLALRLAPNPARDYTSLQFTLAGSTDIGVRIIDLSGRLMASYDLGQLAGGDQTVGLELPQSLSAGVYVIQLYSSQGTMSTKLVKQ